MVASMQRRKNVLMIAIPGIAVCSVIIWAMFCRGMTIAEAITIPIGTPRAQVEASIGKPTFHCSNFPQQYSQGGYMWALCDGEIYLSFDQESRVCHRESNYCGRWTKLCRVI